jgi:hypothetical protein
MLPDDSAVDAYLDSAPSSVSGSEGLEALLDKPSQDGDDLASLLDMWSINDDRGTDTGYALHADAYDDEIYEETADAMYLFIPRSVSVQRVSQNVIGPNVLGRTWTGTGSIEILDSLDGDAFYEVLQHEINHVLYPGLNEREIRAKTRMQVSNPRYH